MIHWACTTMESHFFFVLICVRRGAESEVAQLHLRVLNLQTIPIFYTPPHVHFAIFSPAWYFPSLFNQSSTSTLPACPLSPSLRLPPFISFPSTRGALARSSTCLPFFFCVSGPAVSLLGYIWSG